MNIVSRFTKFRSLIDKLQWFPLLLARFVVGMVFVESGWGKLHNLEKVTEYFTSLGLSHPSFQAHLVACTELCAGSLLLLGLFMRLACIPLSIIMVVALVTAKASDITEFTDIFSLSEFLYIVVFVFLMTYGPGLISLDQMIWKRLKTDY